MILKQQKLKILGRFIIGISFIIATIIIISSTSEIPNAPTEDVKANSKQKGAHVFARMDSTLLQSIKNTNIEWITLVPWSFQDHHDSAILTHHNKDSIYIREHDASWVKRIQLLRSNGFKVFVKPHVWIDQPVDGKWRSYIAPTDEINWKKWKKNYRDFILRYAKVAEIAKAEMFCIGTELSRLVLEHPQFWIELIKEIRTIYSGELTYAANWHGTYQNITFWDDLDYIGVQAYFPLSNKQKPSIKDVSEGWDNYLPDMEKVHKKFNKKILFTELGYKSTSGSAIKPWSWVEDPQNTDNLKSFQTQANCYQAFFDKIWPKTWFAGVHIWQFRDQISVDDKDYDIDFTPQGKPAEFVIKTSFE